jgi:hypothetical protein
VDPGDARDVEDLARRPPRELVGAVRGAFGFLVFTALVKVAVPILYGTLRAETPTPVAEVTTLVA